MAATSAQLPLAQRPPNPKFCHFLGNNASAKQSNARRPLAHAVVPRLPKRSLISRGGVRRRRAAVSRGRRRRHAVAAALNRMRRRTDGVAGRERVRVRGRHRAPRVEVQRGRDVEGDAVLLPQLLWRGRRVRRGCMAAGNVAWKAGSELVDETPRRCRWLSMSRYVSRDAARGSLIFSPPSWFTLIFHFRPSARGSETSPPSEDFVGFFFY